MPLDDKDKEEVRGLITETVTKTLGLEEGQTLADVVTKSANDAVNRYDKSQKREAGRKIGEFEERLAAIDEKLGKGGKPDDDALDDLDPENPDLSKLPAPLRKLLAKQSAHSKELEKQLAEQKKRDEEREAELEKTKAEQQRRELRDTVRSTLLDKEKIGAEFDPTDIDALVGQVEDRVVRDEDSGELKWNTGEKSLGEPVLKGLTDGLKEFAKTSLAKRFQVATPGTGPKAPGPDSPAPKPGERMSWDQAKDLKPHELAEMTVEVAQE